MATRKPSGESLETISPTAPQPGKSQTAGADIIFPRVISTLIIAFYMRFFSDYSSFGSITTKGTFASID